LDLYRLSRSYRTAKRLEQIIKVFLRHGFGRVIDQIRLNRYIPLFQRLKTFGEWPPLRGPGVAEHLRLAFAELGPSFIKFAQILSSRPDLIGQQYADEFKKLQDEVPPFPVEDAMRTIEAELGRPTDALFRRFDPQPVAAASIAQVHKAILQDGSDVVVKIQRPGIREQINTDIDILRTVVRMMERYMPESRIFNPRGVTEEFARTVRKELDFTQEARNCCRFRENFKDEPDFFFPQVYQGLLSEKVLVLERIEGIRIDDIKKIEELQYDRKRLARLGIDAYFKMIFRDGFFHADPHPGNIFAMPTGQVGFVDFGIVGRVTDELKGTLASTFLALINRDFDSLIDNYIELGVVPEDMDLDAFRREFKADLMEVIDPLYGLKLSEINFTEYLTAFLNLALKHNMRTPSELILINKAMLVLENIGLQLDPDFDFIAASEPYARKLITERYSLFNVYKDVKRDASDALDFAWHLPAQMRKFFRKIFRNDIHFKLHVLGLDQLIKDMDRSSNRLSFALVIAAMLVSGSIMHAAGVGPKIFGLSAFGSLIFVLAGLFGVWLLISIIRSGRL
jgi:ubiquinone biosynthesis protein